MDPVSQYQLFGPFRCHGSGRADWTRAVLLQNSHEMVEDILEPGNDRNEPQVYIHQPAGSPGYHRVAIELSNYSKMNSYWMPTTLSLIREIECMQI